MCFWLDDLGTAFNIFHYLHPGGTGGRVLRSDYADPTRRQKAGGASAVSKAPVSQGEGEEAPSAWKQGFKSRLSAAVGAASARTATATAAAAAAVSQSAPVSASASAVVKTGSSLIGAVTPERKALRAEGDKGDKGAVRERAVTPGGGGE